MNIITTTAARMHTHVCAHTIKYIFTQNTHTDTHTRGHTNTHTLTCDVALCEGN